MDGRGRAVRVTAIHQDTINGIDDQMPWPVETWAESADDDTLWTACTARDAGSDELGLWYERGDIIIHSHRISGEGMELSGSRTVIHERGADPMRETLDAIAVWNGRPHRVGRSGRVLSPGVERLTAPGDDEPLRMGWHEALAMAGGALRRMDPAEVRAATLQRCLDLTRKPCVFFLDAEGDDLVVVRWHARPRRPRRRLLVQPSAIRRRDHAGRRRRAKRTAPHVRADPDGGRRHAHQGPRHLRRIP